MSDSELIIKAKKGDLQSFSALIKANQGKVFAYLAVRLSNRHEAEDMTQEVFLTAFKKIKSFDANMPIAPWLRGIAVNILRNHWRKKKALTAGSSSELEALVNERINTRGSDEEYMLELMNACISEADEESAKLIQLRYQQEKSLKYIIGEMKINHSTLTMRLHRIRESLRKCINKKMAAANG